MKLLRVVSVPSWVAAGASVLLIGFLLIARAKLGPEKVPLWGWRSVETWMETFAVVLVLWIGTTNAKRGTGFVAAAIIVALAILLVGLLSAALLALYIVGALYFFRLFKGMGVVGWILLGLILAGMFAAMIMVWS